MNPWEIKPNHVRPTLRETIQKMADDLCSGVLVGFGAGTYRLGGEGAPPKTCIIGARLTHAQIDDIMCRGMGRFQIGDIANRVGVPWLEAQLGMTVSQAEAIQSVYDGNTPFSEAELRHALKELLATGVGYIDGELFELGAAT